MKVAISLHDGKFPQVFWAPLNILADTSSTMVWWYQFWYYQFFFWKYNGELRSY